MNGTFEERVARLEAIEAIRALKAHYARLADAKYTSDHRRVDDANWAAMATAQAACFTDDAKWFGGTQFGGTIAGRAALADWFARSPWRFAMHYYVAPQLTILSDNTAEGRWRLWQIGLPLHDSSPLLLAATTHESYRRTGDAWLICGMRFEEIQQVSLTGAMALLTCTLARETT